MQRDVKSVAELHLFLKHIRKDDYMKIIFEDGNKVLNQEAMDFIKQFKEQPISSIYQDTWKLNPDYEIYGDDLKIEIQNLEHSCAISVKDYDEFQELEYETKFTLEKQELNQLISILQHIYNEM